jgi:exosortase
MGTIAHEWEHKPVYSHGYLVPLFAIVLLWLRRDQFQPSQWSPSWWGLVLIGMAALLRLAGAHFYFEWLDFISILPMLAGLCLLIGGTHALKWAAPSIAFLLFMLPLPYRVEVGLRTPLQHVGTVASCYTLQTVGLPAYAEGNQIHGITEHPLEVEQACSGLGMMMVFFALCAAVVYMISYRPLWERIIVFLSAAPIAIFANVIRISATGTLYAWGFERAAQILHEQLSAFLMMPVALGLLWFELWFFSKLILVEEDTPMSAKLQLHPPTTSLDQPISLSAGRS